MQFTDSVWQKQPDWRAVLTARAVGDTLLEQSFAITLPTGMAGTVKANLLRSHAP